jgi:hypothetical protein
LETFQLDGADDSSAIKYSREYIPNNTEVAPYSLTGIKRSIFLLLYAFIVASTIGGLIYTFYVNPLFGLMILPLSYVINNLLFVIGHSRLHASFIEMPEGEMNVLCHNSFIHHYRNPRVYHEKWLETRMSYFVDARTFFAREFRGFDLYIPFISLILYLINPVLGIAFFSSQYFTELLQSTIHEWYHNPVMNRKTFYSFPVYWALTFLEKTGLASTKHHAAHHRQQLPTLDKVEVWLDLYVPFLETATARMWKNALARYVPGQRNMTVYIKRTGRLFALLAFTIGPAIYAVIFFKYFRS